MGRSSYKKHQQKKENFAKMREMHKNNELMEFQLMEQTPEICMNLVHRYDEAFKYVKEQTPEICMAAVRRNGNALRYVKKQTPEICLAAVQQNGDALQYVKEQTPEICLEAVKKDGQALEHVKEQTPEICIAAVQHHGFELQIFSPLRVIKELTPEIYLAAVKYNGMELTWIKEQTPGICLAAVQQNGRALRYVKEQTPELCIEAIKNTPYALNYVNIQFDITPVKKCFDIEIVIDKHIHKHQPEFGNFHIGTNFIKNLFVFKIDKLELIKKFIVLRKYDIELVKILQEYNYVFSKEQILESIKHKVEIPYVHQYGYNLNDPEFIQEFKQYEFYPESYNLDMSSL